MTSLITDSLGGMGSALYHSLDSRSVLVHGCKPVLPTHASADTTGLPLFCPGVNP